MQQAQLERRNETRKPAAETQQNQPLASAPIRVRMQRFPLPIYYALPIEFCLDPPLSPRGVADPKLVDPFEVAVLAGILYAAIMTLYGGRKAEAYAGGGKTAIAEERGTAKRRKPWVRRREQPPKQGRRKHANGSRREQAIQQAGTDGYRAALAQLRQDGAPAAIVIDISARHLLQLARLGLRGRDHERLIAALARLEQPVGHMPALLIDQARRGSRLSLTVDGVWLDQPFRKIPGPLPLATASALALWLFGFAVAESDSSLDLAGLRRKLCIMRSGKNAVASLESSRAIVNAQLSRLDWAVLKQHRIFGASLVAELGKARFFHPSFTITELPRPFGGFRYRIGLSTEVEADADPDAAQVPEPNPFRTQPKPSEFVPPGSIRGPLTHEELAQIAAEDAEAERRYEARKKPTVLPSWWRSVDLKSVDWKKFEALHNHDPSREAPDMSGDDWESF